MPTPHIVFAELVAKPEHHANLRDALRGLVPLSLAEEGNDAYALHEAVDGASGMFLYERWRDEAAFETHLAASHTRLVFAHFDEWLTAPPRLTIVRDVF